MKFQAPQDCGGVSVMGNFYPADDNGVIEINDIQFDPSDLAPHGYVLISDDAVVTPKKSKKAADPVVAPVEVAPVEVAPVEQPVDAPADAFATTESVK